MSYSSINRVVLVGRLTRDPELRSLPSGQAVCSLRVACNGARKDAEGDYRERPNYFDVSSFGPVGENVSRYMRKGSRVAIDGRLEWREWEVPEQGRRQAVSVVAEAIQFLDSPRAGQAGGSGEEGEDPGGAGELAADSASAEEVDLVF
jgi:single-strand DNA-binding protein